MAKSGKILGMFREGSDRVRCGTDIVAVSRIKELIEEHGEHFKKRVYTDQEISYCESRRMCKYESYAARFAAKEAVYKAISPKKDEEGVFTEVEVLNEETGKPYIVLHGGLEETFKDKKIEVSLSHEKEYAMAMVVIDEK